MLATIERPIAVEAAIEEPTVTFNAVQRQIVATVIASLPSGAINPVFEAPLIAIPGPGQGSDLWTVVWTLVPGFGATSAVFKQKDGIVISTEDLPPRVWIQESFGVPDHPDQWQVTVRNDVISANSFNYVIKGDVKGADGRSLPFSHDPTIVVTQDPIG